MERVVYLLGAGFSAPLGLPVMSNFLEKSKDLFASDRKRFSHFEKVFKTIKAMSIAKNYYESDLFNIEEILSILEMQESLTAKKPLGEFRAYITDVINEFTPTVQSRDNYEWPSAWQSVAFDLGGWKPGYGYFVAALFGLTFTMTHLKNMGQYTTGPVVFKPSEQQRREYAIVTLNYDVVLERMCEYMNSTFGFKELDGRTFRSERLAFRRGDGDTGYAPALAKLHGSVDDLSSVVPPTWNKSLNREIGNEWRLAHTVLKEANHIRILGYSLPIADSYVKYLLKSAIIDTENLKSFDVICRDSTQEVEGRYRHFIAYPKFRFKNADITYYLDAVQEAASSANQAIAQDDEGFKTSTWSLDGSLESAHEDFMDRPDELIGVRLASADHEVLF